MIMGPEGDNREVVDPWKGISIDPPQSTALTESDYYGDDILLFDGFEDCKIGVTTSWSGHERPARMVYSGPLMLQVMMDRDGMTYEEAQEYMDFNVEGAYVGPNTPIVVWPHENEE